MIGNMNASQLLREKEGNVTFGNNNNSTRKPNDPMEGNNVERMKDQRTSAEEQGNSQIWMKNTE